MVCSVGNIADLFKDRGRIGELERQFVERRNTVHNQVLANSRKYFVTFNTPQLEDLMLLYNSLSLEASKLDDEYRRLMLTNQSDPNYEQLMVMYRGVKNIIRREIKNRETYHSSEV
jgi:hypothetical protein